MIEFRNVSKTYNTGTKALTNINLKVDKGEFVFIVGSSGAGKSTFLKLIMCEEKPNDGEIIVTGINVTNIKKRKIPYLRRKMGIVFQDFRLIEHMNVYDNVAFAMRVVGASGKVIRKRVPYILGLVGLQHKAKRKPSELSGGERQRIGLARALVNNPSLIVADEPTGNIDPALSFEIVDLLNEINRRGTTILMVTHEHSLVKHFHKRIIQIHGGEIVADTAAMETAHVSRAQAQEAYEREQRQLKEQEETKNEIAGFVTEEELKEEFTIDTSKEIIEEVEEIGEIEVVDDIDDVSELDFSSILDETEELLITEYENYDFEDEDQEEKV